MFKIKFQEKPEFSKYDGLFMISAGTKNVYQLFYNKDKRSYIVNVLHPPTKNNPVNDDFGISTIEDYVRRGVYKLTADYKIKKDDD